MDEVRAALSEGRIDLPRTGEVRAGKLTEEDRRGLSPLFWSHVNPYGRFRLDMDTRLDLTAA